MFCDQICMYRDQTVWSLMLSTILVSPTYKSKPYPPRTGAHLHRTWPPPLWARPSSSSCRRLTPPTSSLGHHRASRVACCLALPLPSLEFAASRVLHRDRATTARWSHLSPLHHLLSTQGESDRIPGSFVAHLRPHITDSDLTSAAEGTLVRVLGSET
jgi:hypothetical protein